MNMTQHVDSGNQTLQDIKNENERSESLVDSMLAFWIVLLFISLGAATVIYLVWLQDVLM